MKTHTKGRSCTMVQPDDVNVQSELMSCTQFPEQHFSLHFAQLFSYYPALDLAKLLFGSNGVNTDHGGGVHIEPRPTFRRRVSVHFCVNNVPPPQGRTGYRGHPHGGWLGSPPPSPSRAPSLPCGDGAPGPRRCSRATPSSSAGWVPSSRARRRTWWPSCSAWSACRLPPASTAATSTPRRGEGGTVTADLEA